VLRLVSALLVRMGLVLLVLAVLVRLLPMPNRADVMADDFAIAIFLVLVLGASIHLRLTRDAERESEQPKISKYPTSIRSIRR
jgi:hypothetical protein